MLNHVINKLTFTGDQTLIDKILDEIKQDEEGIGSIDFNKIIPMPESLKMESGSIEKNSVSIYLTAVNPQARDIGIPKMKGKECAELYRKINARKTTTTSPDKTDRCPPPEHSLKDLINLGEKYVDNFKQYGATTWYDWSCRMWGTQWNSYHIQPMEGNTLTYKTAWSNAMPVIEKLSAVYPDIEINYKWANDDIGVNVGEIDIQDGCITYEDIPEAYSKEAFELASVVLDLKPAEWRYSFDEEIDNYKYSDESMEQYESSQIEISPQMC